MTGMADDCASVSLSKREKTKKRAKVKHPMMRLREAFAASRK
jgi:hypothetical protein